MCCVEQAAKEVQAAHLNMCCKKRYSKFWRDAVVTAPFDCMQAVAERDVAYENIMHKPVQELQVLANSLGIADKVTVNYHAPCNPAQVLMRTSLARRCGCAKLLDITCQVQAACSCHYMRFVRQQRPLQLRAALLLVTHARIISGSVYRSRNKSFKHSGPSTSVESFALLL